MKEELKNAFEEFIRTKCGRDLSKTLNSGDKALVVDFSKLDMFSTDLADEILENPEDAIVVVLAVVLLFFFTASNKPSSNVNKQELVSECNRIAEEVQASNPKNTTEAGTIAGNFGFCTPKPAYGNLKCGDVVNPTVETRDNGTCRLSCTTTGTAQCNII